MVVKNAFHSADTRIPGCGCAHAWKMPASIRKPYRNADTVELFYPSKTYNCKTEIRMQF